MCYQKPCRTSLLRPLASPSQDQIVADGPGSGNLWKEGQSGCYCHLSVWPDLKLATVSPLPVPIATRKRMVQLQPMVISCILLWLWRWLWSCFFVGCRHPYIYHHRNMICIFMSRVRLRLGLMPAGEEVILGSGIQLPMNMQIRLSAKIKCRN